MIIGIKVDNCVVLAGSGNQIGDGVRGECDRVYIVSEVERVRVWMSGIDGWDEMGLDKGLDRGLVVLGSEKLVCVSRDDVKLGVTGATGRCEVVRMFGLVRRRCRAFLACAGFDGLAGLSTSDVSSCFCW